ncbi:hypothetical protein N0V88_007172 [Collariella sp. IMI 366227]|nr:hypothetical protein N0V88_007172 [Collariella sp. IMI 366227]
MIDKTETAAASSQTPASPAKATSPADASLAAYAAADPIHLESTGFLEADDDPNADETDSLLGLPSGASDTTSIASFVYRYRQQGGRTFHAYQSQGEFKRASFCRGPGDRIIPHIRAISDACPETNVWVPPNVEFFIDDVEDDWNYTRPFDLVYSRFMTGAIKDWPRLMAQAYKHLRPGGWIELYDPDTRLTCDDGSVPEDSALSRWNKLMVEAAAKNGANLDSVLGYKQQLIDAGFKNVRQVNFKWPSNTWPKERKWKEIGAFANINMTAAVQGLTMLLFTQVLGWSTIEVEVLLVDVRKDLKNRDYHAYWPMCVVYGQKPEE